MAEPWTAVDVAFTFLMWSVMMVGMMAGPAAPMLSLFAAMHAQRGKAGVPSAVIHFGAGYLAMWTGFSALATLAQWALHRAALLSVDMATSNARVGGAILIAAGLYQLSPLKRSCLAQCRSPLGFLMTHWRDGKRGAFRMGIEHGIYCLGCCWALMCVLFVVGVMNLLWVAALTLFVLLEKIWPRGAALAKIAGVALIVAGAWLGIGSG
jgi:predicted metal-binding membrane protein